jgi:hypothetical protein
MTQGAPRKDISMPSTTDTLLTRPGYFPSRTASYKLRFNAPTRAKKLRSLLEAAPLRAAQLA